MYNDNNEYEYERMFVGEWVGWQRLNVGLKLLLLPFDEVHRLI